MQLGKLPGLTEILSHSTIKTWWMQGCSESPFLSGSHSLQRTFVSFSVTSLTLAWLVSLVWWPTPSPSSSISLYGGFWAPAIETDLGMVSFSCPYLCLTSQFNRRTVIRPHGSFFVPTWSVNCWTSYLPVWAWFIYNQSIHFVTAWLQSGSRHVLRLIKANLMHLNTFSNISWNTFPLCHYRLLVVG